MEYRISPRVPKRKHLKFIAVIVLGILAIAMFASLIYSGYSDRTTQLSAYSDNWNDLSKFRRDVERLGYSTASIVSSPTMLAELEEPEKTLFVAIGIERAYTTTEARAIYNFIRDGGKVIIADDYGYANSISEYYFSVSFIGHRLWDSEFEKNPKLVKIDINKRPDEGFYYDGNIVLNDPTALVTNVGKMATSTNLSWVDKNDDGVQNIEEISKPYPVIVKKNVQEGSAVFISDSSLFINDMYDRLWESGDNNYQNSDFIMALVQFMLDAGGSIIFDESRHIRENLMDSGRQATYEALVILTTDEQLRWLTAIITILILGLLVISYDDPTALKHIYNVGAFKLTELRDPYLGSNDTERVRYVLLERVRIHLGLSVEEFRDLTFVELEELIGDKVLADFALELNRFYSGSELDVIFKRIKDWPMSVESEVRVIEY